MGHGTKKTFLKRNTDGQWSIFLNAKHSETYKIKIKSLLRTKLKSNVT